MDVGLVCDECRTFNPMGAHSCSRCGEGLSLESGSVPAPAIEPVPVDHTSRSSAPGPSRSPARGSTPTPLPEPGAPDGRRLCPSCGHAVETGFRFCGSCGSAVEEETRPAVRVAAVMGGSAMRVSVPVHGHPAGGSSPKKTLFFGAMQASRAKLVLIKGDGLDGISFTLAGEEHMAGRGEEVPLPFAEDPFMSPQHANFFYRKGKLVVRDEQSVNGVFIRIRGSVPIDAGDRFLVGEQVIEVQSSLPPGEPLRPVADGTYYYASPRPPSHFRLVQLLRGGDTGLAYQAQSDVVSLGREGNDIDFPDDPFISGHHAQVSHESAKLSLTDLGSKNGTFLRVTRESVLEHGDYVFMGQQLLRVEIV